jgi:hypothetical protein
MKKYFFLFATYLVFGVTGCQMYYVAYSDQNGYRYQTKYVSESHNYTQSSITVKMIDRAKNELAWIAIAQADIYGDNRTANDIHPAMHQMLKYFPIKKIVSKK